MKKKAVSMLALLMAVLLCLSGCSQSEKPRSEAQSAEQIIQEEIVVDEEAVQAQSIGLTGVLNARELGGYLTEDGRMVKHGVFLRTAALGEATEEDLQRLQNVYHLSVVADLRRDSEVESDPDPEIPGVRNIHLRIMDEAALKEKQKKLGLLDIIGIVKGNRIDKLKLALKMGVISDQMYVDFLSNDQGKEGYAQMFQELLALPEGQAFLFHCTQGKDRTGLAAALILSALGVDEETILSDFMLTNSFNADRIAQERQMLQDEGIQGDEQDAMMIGFDMVNRQYMENALNWMKETYGSVTGYITTELGVTDEQLETLRNLYLEPAIG